MMMHACTYRDIHKSTRHSMGIFPSINISQNTNTMTRQRQQRHQTSTSTLHQPQQSSSTGSTVKQTYAHAHMDNYPSASSTATSNKSAHITPALSITPTTSLCKFVVLVWRIDDCQKYWTNVLMNQWTIDVSGVAKGDA